MESRRQKKAAVVAEVAADKTLKRERSAEIKGMPAAERKAAKAAAKAAAAQRKAAIKAMPRAERRVAKRHDRMYRKVWNRPRRAVVWVAVLLLVALIVSTAAPHVRDISRMFAINIDSSTPAGQAARAQGALIAEEISDEGLVLLQNHDDLLPLGDKGVNVFGFSSYTMRFGGGGSGAADQSASMDLFAGLEAAGVAYNQDLHAFMKEEGAGASGGSGNGLLQILWAALTGGGDEPHEPDVDYLTDDVLEQAQAFSDVALVVMGNDGVEMQDFTVDQLRITDNQRALLDRVTGVFDHVVLVVNSGNVMELSFLDDYPQIRSALWIGTPGPKWTVSLGKALSGEINPSGRLTSTYARDVSSNPASENFGDYRYSNIKGRALMEYEEGIYVGYRYYETRYEGDEAGYSEAVQFPFGHGLSYTTFDWSAAEPVITEETITVDVTVTNTGPTAGKDVVQVYFSAPWTEGGIEKSAIELAGYAKTTQLTPGASETVTVEFPLRDMASWDMPGQSYVLEQGTYEVKVGRNVHAHEATFPVEVASDVIYETDEVTGAALEARFAEADGGLTYLSRSDWDGTWPSGDDINLTAPQELVDAQTAQIPVAEGEEPQYGVDSGIQLADLQGLHYDDPRWEAFLDQFTLEELMNLFSRGAYQTYAVERLGVPESILLDGPAGINFLFGEVTAASYPTQVVIASTWNTELARRMGEAVGDEANAYGVHGWYAPGMNLHRTPQGGRNFEYFSEDPVLSGTMGAAMTAGAQSRDVLVFMKHFILNDQEVNARSGIHIWANEQAVRELYLRPFEITVKEADASGAMSSFVHVGPTWSGGNPALLQDVLRGEWGFDGLVSTDAVLGGFMDNRLAVRHGNDLMLDVLSPSRNLKQLRAAYEEDPVGISHGLRDRVHTLCYSLLQTKLFR